MPDPLEDRLRHALRQAAGDIPAAPSSSGTRAELLTGLARRRERARRRRGATLGTLAVLALAGIGAAVALPGSPPGRTSQALTVAGSTATGRRSSPAARSGAKAPSGAPTLALRPGTSTTGLHAGGQSPAARHSPSAQSAGNSTTTSMSAGAAAGHRGVVAVAPSYATTPLSTAPPASSTSRSTVIYPSGTGYAVPAGTVYTQIGPPASTPTTIIAPPLSATPYVVTDSDSGQTIDLAVGQTLAVDLSGSAVMPWTEPTSTETGTLSLESGSVNPSTGDAYGLFRAVGSGQAQIVAAASPTCLKFGCEIPSRVWSVTVTVRS